MKQKASELNNVTAAWNPIAAMPVGHDFEVYHLTDEMYNRGVMHTHPYYEFYFFVSGKIRIRIEDVEYIVRPYDFFLFPPGMVHRNITGTDNLNYERAYFYLSEPFLRSMDEEECALSDIVHAMVQSRQLYTNLGREKCEAILHRMDRIIETADSSDPIQKRINRARMVILVATVCDAVRSPAAETIADDDSVASRVMRYLSAHLTEQISLDALAEEMYVSKYHMLHAFKEKTGTTVHQYLLLKRIGYAQLLMQRGMSAADAAVESGFEDYSVFFRAFKSRTGYSPKDYIDSLGLSGGD